MAVVMKLDLLLIKSQSKKKKAQYILGLLKQHEHLEVCRNLLVAVDEEVVEPQIFSIFLSATKSIECVLLCLRQPHSIFIRSQALKQFGRAIRDANRWQEAWSALGSTRGILQYLSEASVWEVRKFFKHVGNVYQRGPQRQRDLVDVRFDSSVSALEAYTRNASRVLHKPTDRALAIEELLKAMFPELYPDVRYTSVDKRPLRKYAIAAVTACSPDFIHNLLEQDKKAELLSKCSKARLIKSHPLLLRDYAFRAAFDEKLRSFPDDTHVFLNEFCSGGPSGPKGKFTVSMTFSEKLLVTRLSNLDVPWPQHSQESDIYLRLLKRCWSKKVKKERLHEIIDLGMQLQAAKAKRKQSFAIPDDLFWNPIVKFWGKWPEHWQSLFLKGLQLGLGGSARNISNVFLKLVKHSGITKERSWELLRLVCRYTETEDIRRGFDLNMSSPDKLLAKQKWTFEAFRKLEDHKIHVLLELLIRPDMNQNIDFLLGAPQNSILSQPNVDEQHNFNARLWLIQLETNLPGADDQEKGREKAASLVERFKNKSLASREQPERAKYAKAAGVVAIASGSLELFGAHVSWLQRFVRDPLTAKVVFSSNALASQEASSLLSAVPDSWIEDLTLGDVAEGVAQANKILLNLHEHQKLAKREPSYQDYDWEGVSKLLCNTIKIRIARARKLQKSLDASQGEMYSAIWSQTFAMFSEVGPDSMYAVQGEMRNLMTHLAPKTLAATTRAMLEKDNTYRATKAAGKEAEDESRIIQNLTYQCLLALAKGDKPDLAEDLIVRTIIDRPDASSWHRQMLSISFFQRLPAKNAEQLLLGFAKAVGEKLEEQSYERVGEPAGTPAFVKVTTVKYLAQLLQDAQFLSPEAAIDVLLELFKVATHPDIRFATLESMLSTLNALCATELRGPITNMSQIKNPLIHRILAALDAVVPVAGSINERRPPRDQDWIDAKEDPSRLFEANGSIKPLWLALTNAAFASVNLKRFFVERLLLPIIARSMTEQRRWMALFLRKHKARVELRELPAVPVDPTMSIDLLLQLTSLVPTQVLEQVDAYARFMLDPPASLTEFVARLKSDAEKSSRTDVQHFLFLFDRDVHATLQSTTRALIDLVHHDWAPSMLPPGTGITLQHMQSVILSHLAVVLHTHDEHPDHWEWLLRLVRHNRSLTESQFAQWTSNSKPLLEEAVRMVNSKRTPEWLQNPERKPSVLPSTWKPELWLLAYPCLHTEDRSLLGMQSRELGAQITDWLREKSGRNRSARIVDDVLTVTELLSPSEIVYAAVVMGTPEFRDADEQILRVGVARALIDKVGVEGFRKLEKPTGALRRDVREMVTRGWEKSLEEDVRQVCVEWKTKNRGFWNEITKLGKEDAELVDDVVSDA